MDDVDDMYTFMLSHPELSKDIISMQALELLDDIPTMLSMSVQDRGCKLDEALRRYEDPEDPSYHVSPELICESVETYEARKSSAR